MFQTCPRLGGNGIKIAPPGDIVDQPTCERSSIRRKLTDHVGNHVVLSPGGAVLVISPGEKSSNPPTPSQSLNDSIPRKDSWDLLTY